MKKCSDCGGTGIIEEDAWAGPVTETCSTCGGTGKDPDYVPTKEEEEQDALDEFENS